MDRPVSQRTPLPYEVFFCVLEQSVQPVVCNESHCFQSEENWNQTCSIQSEVEAMTMIPELPRILLVDDDAKGLWLRAQVMKLCGFPVVTADGSIEALSLMAEATEKIDLAILDYDMPAMNGCDLADHLRSMYPRLKIILYSGAIDIPDNEMSSVDAFVSKDDGTARLLTQIVQLAQIRTRIPQSVVTDTELCFRANSGQY